MAHESCKGIPNELWPSNNPLDHLLRLREASLFMGWGRQDPGCERNQTTRKGGRFLDVSRRGRHFFKGHEDPIVVHALAQGLY